LTKQPPEGADWIHEVKHDGYRHLALSERTQQGMAQVQMLHGKLAYHLVKTLE
jgi:hypothetical protein